MVPDDGTPGGRRPPWALILLAGAGIVIVGAAVILLKGPEGAGSPAKEATTTTVATAPTAPAEPGLVAEFSGFGNESTPAFAVAPNWEIRWQAAADNPFAVELVTTSGKSRGSIIQAGGRTEGTTFVVEGGDFQLRVTAGGGWSVRVISRGQGG